MISSLYRYFLICFLFVPCILQAQEFPQNDFRSPLDIPYSISGTFAEFRRDHFHSGMDIPVPVGNRVRAVADGWVSRIRIQPTGYGKVLYIDHPNGYTSVYAHLREFNPEFEAYFEQKQLEEQTFELDYYPKPGELPVKQGDLIAFSGNSGISTGAHLHFEIRRTRDESPVNPLLFGLPVKDPLKPVMSALRIYAVDARSHIAEQPAPKSFPLVKKVGGYALKSPGIIKVPGKFILGMQSVDLDGSGNRNGLFGMEIRVDDIPVYENRMEIFSFDDFRAINSIVDYGYYLKSRKFVQISRIPDCSAMEIFKVNVNNGIIDVSDDKVHTIDIKVKDYLGNTNLLSFKVQHDPLIPKEIPARHQSTAIEEIPCGSDYEFKRKDLRVFFPSRVLFDTLDMNYRTGSFPNIPYSQVHYIHTEVTPVNGNYLISIKPTGLKKEDEPKACLVRVGAKGGYSYAGGGFSNGWVTGATRKFGAYAVAVDRTPPAISPITHTKKGRKKIAVRNALKFKISDNLSGIGQYCCYLNGEWALMDYNAWKNILTFDLDERLKPGINTFELWVVDKMGNVSSFSKEIVRP